MLATSTTLQHLDLASEDPLKRAATPCLVVFVCCCKGLSLLPSDLGANEAFLHATSEPALSLESEHLFDAKTLACLVTGWSCCSACAADHMSLLVLLDHKNLARAVDWSSWSSAFFLPHIACSSIPMKSQAWEPNQESDLFCRGIVQYC